jgi:hypothetical protein
MKVPTVEQDRGQHGLGEEQKYGTDRGNREGYDLVFQI